MALELATHPETLADIRAKLPSNRLTKPLFDTKRLTKDMENLLSAMMQRHRAGLAPDVNQIETYDEQDNAQIH